MRRRLVQFLFGLTLLLSAAFAVLWVRSYFVDDIYVWQVPEKAASQWTYRSIYLRLWYGGLVLDVLHIKVPSGAMDPVRYYHWQPRSSPHQYPHLRLWPGDTEPWRAVGFELRPAKWSSSTERDGVGILVPFWFLLLVALLFPAAIADRYRRRRKGQGFSVQPTEPH